MAKALASLPAAPGRLRIAKGKEGRTIIDDCYNASPLSVRASLQVLQEVGKDTTKVAVLGDMYELGSIEEQGHRDVGRACADMGVDKLIAIGPKSAWIAEAARETGASETGKLDVTYFEDKTVALEAMNNQSLIPSGSTVLVKASRGMKLEDVVKELVEGEY
jgi:UDP-N-acetylmuramoyl-tripeptide--D-alanyl-D-alanine ligase